MLPVIPMRRCAIAILGLSGMLLSGCATETVELLPDARSPDASDLDASVSDGLNAEAQAGDAVAPPDSAADALSDQGVDTAPPCVCRFINCRDDPECQSNIEPTSTCTQPLCSGSVGTCSQTSDCGSASLWLCAESDTSAVPCSL